MNTLLTALEKFYRVDPQEIACRLGVDSTEYMLIETGVQQLTAEQTISITELLKSKSSPTQHPAPVTIFNIGSHSHAATNVTVYLDQKNRPVCQTTNSNKSMLTKKRKRKQTSTVDELAARIIYTPQFLDALGALKEAVYEFTREVEGKTHEQFLYERNNINALMREVDKEVVKS